MLFGPFDLPIVIGDPSKRRAFMDEAVIALWPLKESLFTAYDRALRQRNRLLKEWDGRGAPPGLEAWDEELIQNGSALIRPAPTPSTRLAPVADEEFRASRRLRPGVRVRARTVAGDDARGGVPSAGSAERRADELSSAGPRSSGPHRDDLNLAVRDLGRAELRLPRGDLGGGALPAARARDRGRRPRSASRRSCSLDDPF